MYGIRSVTPYMIRNDFKMCKQLSEHDEVYWFAILLALWNNVLLIRFTPNGAQS